MIVLSRVDGVQMRVVGAAAELSPAIGVPREQLIINFRVFQVSALLDLAISIAVAVRLGLPSIIWPLRPRACCSRRRRVVVQRVEMAGVDVLLDQDAHVRRTPRLLLELACLANVLRVLLLVVGNRDAGAILLR